MDPSVPGQSVEVESVRFAVGVRPFCVWDLDIRDANLRFLRGVDPTFFLYQARVHQHQESVDTADEASNQLALQAALALRTSYGMALESLFALLCAVVQAPDCVFGWLSSYKNVELETLVTRISSGQDVLALAPFKPPTWDHIAAAILGPLKAQAPEAFERAVPLFARAWKKLAEDFVNDQGLREYNSLKHAFRVQPGKLELQVLNEGRSVFQSANPLAHAFLHLHAIPGKKHQHNVGTSAVVLEPTICRVGLEIISVSIHNILVFARGRAGDSVDATIKVPTDASGFERLWKPQSKIASFTHRSAVTVDDSQYESAEQILAVYEDSAEKSNSGR